MTSPPIISVSAYCLCFNNRETIIEAIKSLQTQSVVPAEIFVIDDGSTDGSVEILEENGIQVLKNSRNKGRGASRKRAMSHAKHELVLCVDATNQLPDCFVEVAIESFKDPKIAALNGRLLDNKPTNTCDRWRAVHLLKQDHKPEEIEVCSGLITWGTIIRKSAHNEVGGFNESLRHSEDYDLGTRLIAGGYTLIQHNLLAITPLVSNSAKQLIERYLRWNLGPHGHRRWLDRIKFLNYGLKVMLKRDLSKREYGVALITLRCLIASLFFKS